MKKLLGCLLVCSFILFFIAPSFALLNSVKNDGVASLVKIGEDIDVPLGAQVNSVAAINGSIVVSGSVAKDVVAIGGSVILKEHALVNGDVVSVGGTVKKAPGAMIIGSVSEIAVPGGLRQLGSVTKMSVIKGLAFFAFMVFVGFLALTALLVALFTPQLGVVSATAESQLGKSLLTGLIVALLFIPVIILLFVSILGIVLIPVWIILVVLAGLFGYIGAAHYVGKKILYTFKSRGHSMMQETLVGVVVLYLIALVPVIGWLIKTIVVLLGLGSVTLTRFGRLRVPS